MKRALACLILWLIITHSYAQRQSDLRITVGTNFRTPYEQQWSDGTRFGGVNLGLSHFKPLGPNIDLKTSITLSRQVYFGGYDTYQMVGNSSDPIRITDTHSEEYYASLSGVFHYMFNEHFSIGAGVGFQILLHSKTTVSFADAELENPNKQYKLIMPTLPVDFCWRGKLMMYSLRAEPGLLNRFDKHYNSPPANFWGLLSFEVGFRIGS